MAKMVSIEVMRYYRDDYDNFAETLTKEKAAEVLASSADLPDYNYSGTTEDFTNFAVRKSLEYAINALRGE